MYDCVPPFLIEIAPWDITIPFVAPPPADSEPVVVIFLVPVKSLLLSTTIALEASTVPAVATST